MWSAPCNRKDAGWAGGINRSVLLDTQQWHHHPGRQQLAFTGQCILTLQARDSYTVIPNLETGNWDTERFKLAFEPSRMLPGKENRIILVQKVSFRSTQYLLKYRRTKHCEFTYNQTWGQVGQRGAHWCRHLLQGVGCPNNPHLHLSKVLA